MAYRYAPAFAAPATDPVLILGAGVAGLSAAYTLQKAGIPFHILEASERVGGRIFTHFNFNLQGQFVEFGGELVDTNHTEIQDLARELGLVMEDVRAGDKNVEAFLCHHNGNNYTTKDLEQRIGPLVDAIVNAQRRGARAFSYREVGKVSAETLQWDRMSIDEFLAGIPNLDAWVRDIVTVAYTTENGLDTAEQSALNLITLIDTDLRDGFSMYGESDESQRIKGGMLKLPLALSEKILKKHPLSISLGARITGLARKNGKIVATYERLGTTHEVSASRAICTLPFSVLRGLPGINNWGLSAKKLECIRELGYGTNSKLMMEFAARPWRAQKSPKAFAGAAYGNFVSQSFWETSRLQPGHHGIITAFLGGKNGRDARFQTLQNNCLPDFAKLCPSAKSQFIKGVAYNWSQLATAKGSYSCILKGQYSKFNGVQSEPEWNGSLLFAGEHVSRKWQSYMNGAVESGIGAAQSLIKSSEGLAQASSEG